MSLKKNICKLLFVLFYISGYGQSIEKYDYIGSLTVNDSVFFSYRLKFNIYKDKIEGYSYTDINGADETKSKISGTYNSKNKEFIFNESEILYTKSIYNEGDFCFVNGTGNLISRKNKSIIKGDFIGKLPNYEQCAVGKFHLLSLKSVERKIGKFAKKAKAIKKYDTINKVNRKKLEKATLLDNLKPSVLKSNENLSVFWSSKQIRIEIWDAYKEDGDKITIKLNNKTVLRSYEIKNKKKYLTLNLSERKNTISFIANSVGIYAPNTATINLIDNGKVINITTKLNINEITNILLIAKPTTSQ